MSLVPALAVLGLQGLLGAYDNFRNHEFREGLPHRSSQQAELALHAAREAAYCVLFPTMAWLEWRGWLVWLLLAIIAAEIAITCWDFVEEDRTRRLSSNERILHTILTLNYGAFLALLYPELLVWAARPAGIVIVNRGAWSWLMTIYSLGVLAFGLREAGAALRLRKWAGYASPATPHQTCTAGLAMPPGLGLLHADPRRRIAKGTAEVTVGAGLARLALRAIGLGMKPGRQPVSVTFEPDGFGEIWCRNFATGRFASRVEPDPTGQHRLVESFGPFAFHYRLAIRNAWLDWHLTRVRLFGVAMPRWLAPAISAAEWIDHEQQYQMAAHVRLPLIGPVLGYECALRLVD